MTSAYGFGRVLGEGAFAHVIQARDRSDGREVAVKVMLKSHIEREGKQRAVWRSKRHCGSAWAAAI